LADDTQRTHVIGQLTRRWAAVDPDATIAWIRSLEPGGPRAAAVAGAVTVIAEAQPQTALELARELPDGPETNELFQKAASAWLRDDSFAALEWAQGVDQPTIKRILFAQHIDNLLSSNEPASAAVWLDRISEPITRDALISRVSETWGRLEARVAWQWGRSLAEGESRSIAIQNILSSWAEHDPIEAATAAINELPPQERARGVLAVLLSWTQTDPAAAASWVSLFPESPLRETATQNVVGNWALQDIECARQWLEGLPAGASRDAALLTWHSMQASFTGQ
jgi:hypothetical protein